MIVTTKDEVIRVAAYLKEQAEKLGAGQYSLSAALTNVAFNLEQAAEGVQEDESHPHIALTAEQVPNALDGAISHCCTINCPSYGRGDCRYFGDEKRHCWKIASYLEGEHEQTTDHK